MAPPSGQAGDGKAVTLIAHQAGTFILLVALSKSRRAEQTPPFPPPLAQLYFSRRQTLYIARHQQGDFHPENAVLRDMRSSLAEWEQAKQVPLGKLVELVREIRLELMKQVLQK